MSTREHILYNVRTKVIHTPRDVSSSSLERQELRARGNRVPLARSVFFILCFSLSGQTGLLSYGQRAPFDA